MTNKEKYKQAFSALHVSDDFSWEAETMKGKTKHRSIRAAVIAAACVVVVGSATAVYAADVGGIQRTVQLWFHGDQTSATIQFDGSGNYTMEYTDSQGEVHEGGGGGVAYENGTERPLTDEELISEMNSPEVEYKDDGSVWVYWFDQKLDITDKFEDGFCYVKLENGDETLYLTVKYQDGYAASSDKYEDPSEFD